MGKKFNNSLFISENLLNIIETKEIEMKLIQVRDEQKRKDINKENLILLAESIETIGLIHPITVVKEDGYYRLVAGFRRFNACMMLEKPTIYARIVKEDEQLEILIHLEENAKREKYNEYEEAQYFADVIQRTQMTQEQLAKLIGKTPAYISQRLAMFRWHPLIKEALIAEQLSYSACRELMRVDNEPQLVHFVNQAIEQGANWSTIKRWVDDYADVQKYYEAMKQPAMPIAAEPADPAQNITPLIGETAKKAEYILENMTDGEKSPQNSDNIENTEDDERFSEDGFFKCEVCGNFYEAGSITHLLICDDCSDQVNLALQLVNDLYQAELMDEVLKKLEDIQKLKN